MSDKHYAHFLGVSQFFALSEACNTIINAFDGWSHVGCYLVGSAMTRRDWRDVDVRLMMTDEAFDKMFGGVDDPGVTLSPLILLNAAVSEWLQRRTGLPVDFQFQRMSDANAKYSTKDGHKRNAVGFSITRKQLESA